MNVEPSRAAALHARLKDQLWRQLVGDEEEALKLALPAVNITFSLGFSRQMGIFWKALIFRKHCHVCTYIRCVCL